MLPPPLLCTTLSSNTCINSVDSWYLRCKELHPRSMPSPDLQFLLLGKSLYTTVGYTLQSAYGYIITYILHLITILDFLLDAQCRSIRLFPERASTACAATDRAPQSNAQTLLAVFRRSVTVYLARQCIHVQHRL